MAKFSTASAPEARLFANLDGFPKNAPNDTTKAQCGQKSTPTKVSTTGVAK